jgi:glycerophosphoryl diester phosphodiesterase
LTSVNVLSVVGMGGDQDALRDHGATWGRLIDAGVSAIQTDEPEALMSFLKSASQP